MTKKKISKSMPMPKVVKRGLLAALLAVAGGGAKQAGAQTPFSVGLGAANRSFASGMVLTSDGQNLGVSTAGMSHRRGRSVGYSLNVGGVGAPVAYQGGGTGYHSALLEDPMVYGHRQPMYGGGIGSGVILQQQVPVAVQMAPAQSARAPARRVVQSSPKPAPVILSTSGNGEILRQLQQDVAIQREQRNRNSSR